MSHRDSTGMVISDHEPHQDSTGVVISDHEPHQDSTGVVISDHEPGSVIVNPPSTSYKTKSYLPTMDSFNEDGYTPPPAYNGIHEHKSVKIRDSHMVEIAGSSDGSPETDKDSMYTDEEDDDSCVPRFTRCLARNMTDHGRLIRNLFLIFLLSGFTVYFGFALHHSLDGATALIGLTSFVAFLIIYTFIRDRFGHKIYRSCLGPLGRVLEKNWHWIKWLLVPAVFLCLIMYMTLELIQDMRQLQSVSGLVIFIIWLFITSKHPTKIIWRPVIFGFVLQFILGILVLRWEYGFMAIEWLSDQVTTFIYYAFAGAAVIFGDPMLLLHPYAFVGMPMLIYVGAVMSILYYFGFTQIIASKVAWFVQVTMGTTAIESLGVAANIFLNGMDTMLMLRSYLSSLTKSEFHCFLVGNHATVAGFIFGLFVLFGAPPQHLLSAAVMSAPASIAISKLNYPETEVSVTKSQEDVELAKGVETNVFEATANGAAVAGKTVTAVVVNFIAFISMLAFVNASLSWIGSNVGYPELSFEIICSYLFWPLALVMGVDPSDCGEVGKLVGIKVFTSEVLAYQELGISIRRGLLSARSSTIATYALCGFSGMSTLAVAVGVWNVVCPQRTSLMASLMFRVIVNANISCFMTASIAGLMYDPSMDRPEEGSELIMYLLSLIPSYRDLMALAGF